MKFMIQITWKQLQKKNHNLYQRIKLVQDFLPRKNQIN